MELPMTPRFAQASIVLALFAAAAPLYAQEPRSAEDWAQVREGEVARLDMQTIRKYGDIQGSFEVLITWASGSRAAPEDYAARTVRYMADCDAGTITLAAVGLYDRNGNVARTMIVPPRSVDPVKPAKGSDEAKWLQRTCMF
jgi:hypothetical protein